MLLAGKECREGVAHQNALLPEDKKIRKQERDKGEREGGRGRGYLALSSEVELRAFVFRAINLDLATHKVDKPLRNKQPQPTPSISIHSSNQHDKMTKQD